MKMKFGEWIGAVIAGNAGAKVMKIGNSYFDMAAIQKAAEAFDPLIMTAQLEGRKLTPLESLMVEILISQAGWKNMAEAVESYQRHLNSKDD